MALILVFVSRPWKRPCHCHDQGGEDSVNNIFLRHKWEPYLWILPSVLLMLIFVLFPIGIGFRLAFS